VLDTRDANFAIDFGAEHLSGGKESGTKISPRLNSAQLNLRRARLLQNLFNQAGASVFLLRDNDITLSKQQRIQLCNNIPGGGYYLRLNLDNAGKTSVFNGGYYAGNERGRNIQQTIASRLIAAEVLDKSQIAVSDEPEVRLTNRAALSLDLHLNSGDSQNINDEAYLAKIVSAILKGFLIEIGQRNLPAGELTVKVMNGPNPLPGAEVSLNSIFPQLTDQNGECNYEFLEPGIYTLTIQHPSGSKIELPATVPGKTQLEIIKE